MSVEITWLGMEDASAWRKQVLALPDQLNDVYLLPECVALYRQEDATPQCFLFRKAGETFLYPFLQRKTPFLDGYYDISTAYGYGGPVYTTSDRSFLSKALEAFDAQARDRNIVAELIKFNPMLANHVGLEPVYQGTVIPVCNTVFVEIGIDEEYRWTTEYSKSNRQGVKKAQQHGATMDFSDDDHAWERFIHLYSKTMARNNASDFYHFSEDYFKTLREGLTGNYTLCSAIVDGVIAAGMILIYGKQFAYWHLIGTEKEYQRIGINNFMHHHCIQWCKEKGIKRLLTGGGRTREDDDALLQFKKRFSKQLSMFHVGERVLDQNVYDKLVDIRNSTTDEPADSGKLFKYRF